MIEWLLHDDQVMRECFTHAAEILKSMTGAAITAIHVSRRLRERGPGVISLEAWR